MVKTNNNKDFTVFDGFFGGERGILGSNMRESSTLRHLCDSKNGPEVVLSIRPSGGLITAEGPLTHRREFHNSTKMNIPNSVNQFYRRHIRISFNGYLSLVRPSLAN